MNEHAAMVVITAAVTLLVVANGVEIFGWVRDKKAGKK